MQLLELTNSKAIETESCKEKRAMCFVEIHWIIIMNQSLQQMTHPVLFMIFTTLTWDILEPVCFCGGNAVDVCRFGSPSQ